MADASYIPKIYHKQGGDELVIASGGAITLESGATITVDGVDLIGEIAALDGIDLTELGYINGVTAGTGLASKALVLNSSGNVAMPATGIIGLSRAALAAAGSDSTDAAVIATQVVAVTASDGTKGVALPLAATTTGPILVINTVTTAALKVYPVNAGNDNINALAEDAAFTIGAGKSAWFIPTSATQWYCADLAAVSATTTELNYNDVTTLGTAQASKTVTADANIDVTSLRNATLTGALDAQTLKADAVTLSPLKWVDVAVTAAALDAAGNVPVIAGVAGDQYKIRDVILVGGGTNFGAGGDRLISLTDGTTVWTTIANADIETAPAASLRLGDVKVPFLTSTSNTASASAAAIRFQYSGGTTDHGGTGSISFSVCLEKTA